MKTESTRWAPSPSSCTHTPGGSPPADTMVLSAKGTSCTSGLHPPPRPKPGLSSINPLRIFNFFLCQLLFLSPSLSLVPRCQALCWFPCSPASSTCTHNPYTCVSSPALGPEHTTGASTSPQTRALNKAYPELKFSWHPLLALYL